MMKFIFGMQRNSKICYNLILSFWVCPAIHAQSTQNRKFAYLCNISRKTWGMKLLFFLQTDTKVSDKVLVSFWMCVSRLAQSTQKTNLQYLCNISKKMERMKLAFCLQINIKDFFKLILSLQVQRGMPKVPKITSLLFLCNILRKT